MGGRSDLIDAPRTCLDCRFHISHDGPDRVGFARCGWVTGTVDEAGDLMPQWAHAIVALSSAAYGPADRADDCPAFDART